MSRHALLPPMGELLGRARASRFAADRHQLAFYALEATLKTSTVIALASSLDARPPDAGLSEELRGLGRASLGTWLQLHRLLVPDRPIDLGDSWRELAEAAVATEVVHPQLRSLASRSTHGALALVVAYRNAVLGHGAWRDSGFYDRLAPRLLAAAERLAGEPALLGGGALWVADANGDWIALGGEEGPAPDLEVPAGHPVLTGPGPSLDLFPLLATRRHPTQGTAQLGLLNQVRARSRPDGSLRIERSRFLDYTSGEIFDVDAPDAVAALLAQGRLGGEATTGSSLRLARSTPEPGELEALASGFRFVLFGRTRVGRRDDSDLVVAARHVSSEHARVFWSGSWQLRDLGSRNGCWVDDRAVPVGVAVPLTEGSVVAFGSPLEQWRLRCAGPPVACAVSGSETRRARGGLLVLPSEDDPACTILLDPQGRWVAETAEGACPVRDRETLVLAGKAWELFLPETDAATTYASDPVLRSVRDALARFEVGEDGPVWTLVIPEAPDIAFANRPFVRTAWSLAKARQADPHGGWSTPAALAEGIGLTEPEVVEHLQEARRALNVAGFLDGSSVVEWRDDGRVRFGMGRIEGA